LDTCLLSVGSDNPGMLVLSIALLDLDFDVSEADAPELVE
jgi:hypothetical protein